MLPALFFFLRVALGLFWSYRNFRIICSRPVKNITGNMIGITLNYFIFDVILKGIVCLHSLSDISLLM